MAYTGTGTQTDPFIVDNWTDFTTCAGSANSGSYVKWAELDEKVCDLSSVSTVILYCQEVDFNGWTFTNLNGTNNYGTFWIYTATTIKNGVFSGAVTSPRILYNRHANGIYIDNMYFDFTVTATNGSIVYLFHGNGVAGKAFINKSIIKLTQGRGTYAVDFFYLTGASSYMRIENSEIELDLTNTIPNTNLDGLFDKSNSGYTYFKNSYIHGNIGSYTTIFPTSSYSYNMTHNSIFSFTNTSKSITYGGMSLPISNTTTHPIYDSSVPRPTDPYLISLFIPPDDTQMNHSGVTNSSAQLLAMLVTSENVNYNYISNLRFPSSSSYGFAIIENDNVRYPQFSSDTDTTENWEFRIDPAINNGLPFLPFWKYETVEMSGAFYNATSLSQITIPKSVKYIGTYAFQGTNLTSVTIANDCTYSATSFPSGCTIKFY